jgi:hypothetical protein
MYDVMISLRKLENGWRERIALRREHPEKYSCVVENVALGRKLDQVALNLGKCKAHMGAIIIQVVRCQVLWDVPEFLLQKDEAADQELGR